MRRLVLCVLLACSGPPGVADGGSGGGSVTGGGSGGATGGGSGGGSAPGGGAGGGTATGDGSGSDAGFVWVALPSLPVPRQETGVAALGGDIYVVGGFTGAGVVPTVEAYDPASRSWRDAGVLPLAVHHANVAAVNGKLYVVGALTGLNFAATRAVYEYDPATRTWTPKAQLPAGTERGGAAVAVAQGRIYLAGGFRQGAAVADFSSYDPSTDTHAPLAPLPVARDHLVGGAVGDSIFAIGGRSGSITALDGRVDRYDIMDGGWRSAAPMLTPRGGCAAGVSGTRIIVAGGEGNRSGPASNVFPHVEVFDTVANSWADAGVMRTARHGTGGAVVNGVFYVPGGATVEAFGATDIVEAVPFP